MCIRDSINAEYGGGAAKEMGNGASEMRAEANVLVVGMAQCGKKTVLDALSEVYGAGETTNVAYAASKGAVMRSITPMGMKLNLFKLPLQDLADGAAFHSLGQFLSDPKNSEGFVPTGVDGVILILDAADLASDYKLQPKVVKALERPLRNMMIKGGCRNAALLIYVNKYDLLRKEKQSEEDYMSVVSQVGNIVAAEFKWCAPLVMAANCFTIKAREPRSMEDGIIWLCSVLAHTGVDNPNK
eukprot:TRINITY_DN1411_c0_g2_i3.p1 TRINITY_DN1411_c0_g2~~TRINITY_DN1411_c0_g2_i3.p1  ORF type:complete len:242 (+),score=62.40 TRINITY_DN1411_c0_g2_i3:126-851(+)